jgi:hypothetical protein
VGLTGSNVKAGHLGVPEAALDLGGHGLPEWLLIQSADGAKRKPRVVRTEALPGAPNETALKAGAALIRDLGLKEAPYAAAEIKHASLLERLRYDATFRVASLIALLSVAAAAWGVAGEATGDDHAWIKIVAAAFVLAGAVVGFRTVR